MQKVLLNAVTATTTSSAVPIENLGDITLQCSASAISTGNGAFTVEVSNDGVIWTAFNMLVDNVTNTNGQTLTRVSTKSVSANGSAGSIVLCLEARGWKMIRVTVTRTTDGTYTCVMSSNSIAAS